MLRLLPLALLLPLLGCPGPKTVRPRIGDAAGWVAVTLDSGTLTLERDASLLTFAPEAFQLGTVPELDDTRSYDPFWLEVEDPLLPKVIPQGLRWRSGTQAAVNSFSADTLELSLSFEGGRTAHLTVKSAGDGRFSAELVPDPAEDAPPIAFIRLRPRAGPTEAFYGLGEWFDTVNHRGKLRPMQLEPDLFIESSSNEAHVPVPLLIGTRGWGLFVQSQRPGLFDVARKEADLVEVTFGTGAGSAAGLTFHLFSAEEPLDITRRYYDVTGYPTLPAPWALGPWVWRDESQDQAQVLDDARQLRDLDLATSGLWIDRPYATAVNTFDFDAARFPDPAAMVRALNAQGLRLALWHTPYLEPTAEPLRSAAADAGYFPPSPGLLLNRWSAPVDFTNPAAYAFWQQLIGRYRALGVEGFKLDYGEDVVPGISGNRTNWTFADGSDERTMHAGYTLQYHRAYAETLPADGGFLLCRAGRWGDQKNGPIIWPGDIDATLTRYGETFQSGGKSVRGVGGLPSAVVAGLSLGPSGFPFFGADTGGYRHSPPNKETWVRWVEQSALSSVMQTGDSSSQMPWEQTPGNGRDAEALEVYRRYARLHLRLFPYEWTYAQQVATDGRPILRALGLAFPALGVHPDDEYLFGGSLLVAPVMSAGATERTLVLPPGEWIDWWDGTSHDGGESGGAEITVPAPLGKLPLFLRAGGIVPLLRPTIDTLSPAAPPVESYATDPGVLYVRLAMGKEPSSGFELFDGSHIAVNHLSTGTQVTWRNGKTFKAGAILEILRAPVPQSVGLDSTGLAELAGPGALEAAGEGWAWEAAMGGTLWVRIPPGEHSVLLR
ncbi:MAG: TIM-barrel domain-containing protein [Myxococcaceae bacterium]